MSELPSPPEDAVIALPVSVMTDALESRQNTSLTAGSHVDESEALPPEGSDAFSHDGDDDLSSEEPDPVPSENVWESSVDPRSQNRERQRRDYRNKRFRLGGVRVDARGMGNAYGGDHHGDTVFNITTASDTGGNGTAVPEEQIDFLQDVHVDGGTLQLLTSAFANERVAVLHGEAGTGRTTSAIIALRSVDHDNPVIRVAPEKLLSELSAPGADASHYLVRSTRRAWPWEDDEMVRVKSLLETQHSHLVVVIDDEDVPARWRSLLVRHTAPEPLRVLRSHLAHHIGGEEREDRAGALLDRVRVQTRIKDCLDSIESPGEAARTAWFIKDRSDREEPDWLKRLANLLEKNRDEMLLQRARDLLRGLDHRHAPVDQAYVISSAVLDGHTLTTVVSAAGDLAERLVRVEFGSRAQRRRIFERRLDHRLPHVRLDEQTFEPDGGPPERTLRLRQPRLWSAVLDVAWTEYELSRGPFLEWLVHLCEMPSDDPRVRIDAAQAIGRIAAHDFAIVEKQVLKRWITTCEDSSADKFDPQLPLMAAWIIEMLVVEGSQIDRAFDLLERWMREGSPWKLLYALTAYGTSIAVRYPEKSFRAIDMAASEIGRSGMGRAFGSATGTAGRLDQFVESAVVEAFDGNSPRARAMALEHLVTWHRDDQRPRLHRMAVRTLLKIAQLPTRCQDGSRGRDFALVEWLVAAVADPHPDTHGATPDTVQGVHDLWLDALRDNDDLSPAWTVLDDWEHRYPDHAANSAARECIDALLERIRSDPDRKLKERFSLYTIIRERRNGTGWIPPTPA
ncbi:hypothetical protein [Nocardiopsis sp. HUAS JQ3]|uniref:hypothetical protein n=1 Tax=Nocardiopsis sp. HUAS JQ3 TaxID=3061629 RepID=UPI0023A9895C|nr:hypothetical protein [Nocardiopsis sp. HUAS JQ3]WDZ90670.1 hypothetical protein PV789_27945 [Nocardiopsis sp. HUAS JQ3]